MQRRRLCPDPDVAAILLQMNGAVHRLHRRMGQERHLINRPRVVAPPPQEPSRHRHRYGPTTPGFLDASSSWRDDIGVADLAIRPVVPRDGGSLEPLLRRTHVIGDHGNSFIDVDHLPDALHCQRGLLVHRFRLATEHRRNSNRRNLHTRQSRVDAVERVPIDLYRESTRLARVPIRVKSFGSFNLTLAAGGTGNFAAAFASSP